MALHVFMSTGEASGEMSAVALAGAMRALQPEIAFAGIGGDRMRANGFELSDDTRGWASMGPLEAIPKIPPLFAKMWRRALALRANPPDLVVLVDFGAFNIRLAKTLRLLGYRGPVLYYFPPSAWLDRPGPAKAVARWTTPLTAFVHQRDYYRSLGLEIAYFGHPLVSSIAPRPRPVAPPADGGTVALLPGSRRGAVIRHFDRLVSAFALLRADRPRLVGRIGASDGHMERLIGELLARREAAGLTVVRGAAAALEDVNAAWIKSGTAVLEATLREVPTVAFYVVRPSQVKIARRIWAGPYITLPNIVLGREVVPELLQDDATPERLANALGGLLADPSRQLAAMADVRAALGPPDALQQCARFALELAER
jgi:lipid-A-disaccharide synthase